MVSDGFGLVKGKHHVWFVLAHVSSFDLLAYERDNQHQDEAEEDPENGHKPRGQGLKEADPDSEADVSVLSSGHDTWKLTDRKGAGRFAAHPASGSRYACYSISTGGRWLAS